MTWRCAFPLFAVLAVQSPALAVTLRGAERLAEAEAAYDDYHHERASVALKDILRDADVLELGPAARQRALFLLALSSYLLERRSEAEEVLQRLFSENADYAFDRDAVHPELLTFYDEARRRYSALHPPSSAPTLITRVAVAPTTFGDQHPWLRAIPAGGGQFANHDYLAGGLFLTAEVALVVVNIVAAGLRQGMRTASGEFRPGTHPETLQFVQNASGIGAISLAIFGVVDAFVWSPARGRSTLGQGTAP